MAVPLFDYIASAYKGSCSHLFRLMAVHPDSLSAGAVLVMKQAPWRAEVAIVMVAVEVVASWITSLSGIIFFTFLGFSIIFSLVLAFMGSRASVAYCGSVFVGFNASHVSVV